MAHRSTPTSIWTTFLAALVALFTALGFGGKAAPAAAASVSSSLAPAATTVTRPAFMARQTWRAMMRGGSLPPTIKQRIRAEAHGKTPSVRSSRTAAALATGSGSGSASGSESGFGFGLGSDGTARTAAVAAASRVGAAHKEMALAA
ncbi:DUF6344 domain-containing protein [Streptomyces sp. ISL-66]|uniref:DUF6344 domain-containing protein n=1 Tax=Streptomyces sp. ISL-66 TaxID=2819186 RepID=UPI002034B718|nr:DUF6344 domain-containing protein [Streptomyces sp. ISL-66]